MSRIYKIKNFKIENLEIAKSFLGSLRVQRYIVFMSLHDSSASFWTSKNGLPCDLSKMPEAITRWPLLVELQYWLSRLQRVRLPYRPSFRFLWNMRVLILEIFGRFVLECPSAKGQPVAAETCWLKTDQWIANRHSVGNGTIHVKHTETPASFRKSC